MEVKLKFFYGAMGCGKTRKMQGDYYSKIEDGFNAIIIKPGIDKKADGDTLARDGSKFRAEFLIDKQDNIYDIIAEYLIDNNLDFVFVDEAQFLESYHIDELTYIVDILGVNVYCYGLRTDFKTNLFSGSKRLFEVADELIPINRQCSCGNTKIYNMRIENNLPVFSGEQIAIDGIDARYESSCRKCYNSTKKKILSKGNLIKK